MRKITAFIRKHLIASFFLLFGILIALFISLCCFLAGKANNEFEKSIVEDAKLKEFLDEIYVRGDKKNCFQNCKGEEFSDFQYFHISRNAETPDWMQDTKTDQCTENYLRCEHEFVLSNLFLVRKLNYEKEGPSQYNFLVKSGLYIRKNLLLSKYLKFLEFLFLGDKKLNLFANEKTNSSIIFMDQNVILQNDDSDEKFDYKREMGRSDNLERLFEIYIQKHRTELTFDFFLKLRKNMIG